MKVSTLKCKIHTEPDFGVECITLLSAYVNNESIEKDQQELIDKYAGYVDETNIKSIFAESVFLEHYVWKNIRLDNPRLPISGRKAAEFLYKNQAHKQLCHATAFYFYDMYKQKGIGNKLVAILGTLLDDRLSEEALLKDAAPNDKKIYDYLDLSDLDDAIKYEIVKLYHNFEPYYAYHTWMVAETTRLILEIAPMFTKKTDECLRLVREKLVEEGSAFIHALCGVEISDEFEYDIYPSLYQTNSLSILGTRWIPHKINIGLGMMAVSRLTKNAVPVKVMDFLRTLSDSTKFSILQSLKEGPCYGSQLAEKLSLTGATISYHMSALKKLDVILLRKDAAKVYFSLNPPKIKEYVDELWRLLTE